MPDSNDLNNDLKRLNILLRTIIKINQQIAASNDEKKLCKKICHYLVRIKGYKLILMGLKDIENNKITPIAIAGKDRDFIKYIKNSWKKYNFNGYFNRKTLESGMPFLIEDLTNEERFVPWDRKAIIDRFLSALVLPIKYYNDVIGILHIYSDIKNYFIKEEVSFLNEVAGDISIGIKSIRDKIELIESKSQYEEIFRKMSSCVAIYKATGNGNDFIFKDFNRAAEKADKIKREDIIGKSVLDVFPSVKDFGLFDIYRRVYKTGMPENHPVSIYKDGRISGWRENFVYKLPSGDIVALYNDLTAKKQAEEELVLANERLNLAQKSIGAVVWDWDMNTEKLNWSPEFYILFGLDPVKDTANFGTWCGALHPEDRQMTEVRLNKSIKECKPFSIEYRIVLPSGEIRWINTLGNTIYNEHGKAVRMLGICIDITKRKKIEEALCESENKYRTVFNTSNEGIIIAEIETQKFKCVNPAICQMLGYSEKELKTMDIAAIHPKKDLQGVLAKFQDQIRGINSFATDIPCLRKDGTIFYADINSAIITIDGWKCIAGFFNYTTDRKKYEQEFINLLRFLSENPNPVMRLDYEGRVLYFNKACESIPGWKQKISSTTMKAIIKRAFKAVKSKSDRTTSIIQFGKQIYELAIANIKEYKYINIYLKDITKRVNAEKALNEAIKEKKIAASAERIRMERELHDSLSQTIFSTNLLADIMPSLWKKDRQEALKQLEKIKLLTRETQYQFRRILLELKPGAFLMQDLRNLIRQLAYSLKIRTDIPVEIRIKGNCNISIEVKEAFYRICQEALNNIIKHSCASLININLECLPEKTYLKIKDNGVGFDKNRVSKKSLGLSNMYKRAKDINAVLMVHSKIGRGTKITVNYKN